MIHIKPLVAPVVGRLRFRPMRRPATLVALTFVLAACGSSNRAAPPTTTGPASPASVVGSGAKTLYRATNGWAVVQRGERAFALRLTTGRWRVDRSGAVRIRILGPQHTAPRRTQFAVEISAPNDLAETALWVDGEELLEKGGGSARKGTIYGTTSAPLHAGRHVAVAYGRTATTATAVAWTFRVV